MRVLVTGRDGQVASSLRKLAPDAGVALVTLGRPEFDLDRPETLRAAILAARPDLVISAAAYTAVDQAETDAERAGRVNGEAPGVIAAAAAELDAPVVHLSTDYVFDGTKASPYVETDPTNPATVYGVTKLIGERAVAAANPRHAVLRTAWVFAPQGKNFVTTMLRLAQTRDEVAVVVDQHGGPTYAPDLAAGVLRIGQALVRGEGRAGLYHLAGTGEASWADFASAIFDGARCRGAPSAIVRPIPSSQYPTPAKRPANSRLDCGLARDVFGVELRDWRSALDACLDAYLDAGLTPPAA